jgi:glycosyltransferase involved in cell wall biosynthesis
MKILHVGWGFRPWRGGGLIEYAEDLMEIQAYNGHEVSYFCAGRHYPFTQKTRLIKWKRRDVVVYEVINSPIVHYGYLGTSRPNINLSEPKAENLFRKVINFTAPQIVHIQELAGLPSSLIDIAIDEFNLPVVLTLHDYFLLCPTLNLFDDSESVCSRTQIGTKCIICCKNAPANNDASIERTIHFYKVPLTWTSWRIYKRLRNIFETQASISKNNFLFDEYSATNFQNRRDTNIKRLRKINLLISQSNKVTKIYNYFTRSENIITLHSTVAHIESIRKRTRHDIKRPIIFSTLNGCASNFKGAKVISEAVGILNKRGLREQFRLEIWGGFVDTAENILSYDNVTYQGFYDIHKLDSILDKVDVGIIPSVWEEVYGYVGVEYLAKGVPIIGNNKGGITDYTVDDFTGWVNKTSSAQELADIMEKIIKNPAQVLELNHKIINNSKYIIKNIEDHFIEINRIYDEVVSNKQREKLMKKAI